MTVQLPSPAKTNDILFTDLPAQLARIRPQIDQAIQRVLDHGCFIMGPEVSALEQALSEFCGAKYVITCANGTDAIGLSLMAKEVGPGDAIFVPSFTFAATAEAVAWTGASVVFVDCLASTYNLDPMSLEQGIQTAIQAGLNPKGVIAVDLFGQPADYQAIQAIALRHGLFVIGDAAQSFGATYQGKKVGTLAEITTTSFFPAKPLGCYGDGGAIFTDDLEIAEKLRSLRIHGKGKDKYDNVRIGMNSRLDTLQAAILLEKLAIFPSEIDSRNAIASQYTEALIGHVITPSVLPDTQSTWAQYTIQLPSELNRNQLIQALKNEGIPTAVYYPKPLHQQTAYKTGLIPQGGLPVSERLSECVLSLPMSGYLSSERSQSITDKILFYTS